MGSSADAVTALIVGEGLSAVVAAGRLGLPVALVDGEALAVVVGRLSPAQIEWAHGYILSVLRERHPEWFEAPGRLQREG